MHTGGRQSFGISESCYCYERTQDAVNAEVSNGQLRLTDNHRNWDFGLCYLCATSPWR